MDGDCDSMARKHLNFTHCWFILRICLACVIRESIFSLCSTTNSGTGPSQAFVLGLYQLTILSASPLVHKTQFQSW